MNWSQAPLDFVLSVVKHWIVFITGGLLIAGLTLWQWLGRAVHPAVYGGIVFLAVVMACYEAWWEQRKIARNALAELEVLKRKASEHAADIRGEIAEYYRELSWDTIPEDFTSAAVLRLSLVNHGPVPVAIRSFALHLITPEGTVHEATRLFPASAWTKGQKVNRVGRPGGKVEVTEWEGLTDIQDELEGRRLLQAEPVEGWLAFLFNSIDTTTLDARPRIVLTDILGNRHVIEGATSYAGKNTGGLVEEYAGV
jgi:hypothetical protein